MVDSFEAPPFLKPTSHGAYYYCGVCREKTIFKTNPAKPTLFLGHMAYGLRGQDPIECVKCGSGLYHAHALNSIPEEIKTNARKLEHTEQEEDVGYTDNPSGVNHLTNDSGWVDDSDRRRRSVKSKKEPFTPAECNHRKGICYGCFENKEKEK